jgi:Tfp pilus assembly protein PilN
MIRINLLPAKRGRVSKKAIELRNFLLVTGAGLAVVVLGSGAASWIMASRIASLENQKVQVQAQLKDLQAKAATIRGFEADRKAFEDKIKIIQRLKSDQGRPVKFLDTLAHRIPDRVWLIHVEESGGKVSLTGRAVGNNDIVEMIQQVKADNFLTDVQLVESRRIKDRDLNAYEFTLTGRYDGAPDAVAEAMPGNGPKDMPGAPKKAGT